MYRMLFLTALLALMGCSHPKPPGCPALEPLLKSDPKSDARAAFVTGDRAMLMIGGYGGTMPGAEGSRAMSRPLQGATETETPGCVSLRAEAVRYATLYNREMVLLSARAASH